MDKHNRYREEELEQDETENSEVEAEVVEEVKPEPAPVIEEKPKVEVNKVEPDKEIPVINNKPGIKYIQVKGTATL